MTVASWSGALDSCTGATPGYPALASLSQSVVGPPQRSIARVCGGNCDLTNWHTVQRWPPLTPSLHTTASGVRTLTNSRPWKRFTTVNTRYPSASKRHATRSHVCGFSSMNTMTGFPGRDLLSGRISVYLSFLGIGSPERCVTLISALQHHCHALHVCGLSLLTASASWSSRSAHQQVSDVSTTRLIRRMCLVAPQLTCRAPIRLDNARSDDSIP